MTEKMFIKKHDVMTSPTAVARMMIPSTLVTSIRDSHICTGCAKISGRNHFVYDTVVDDIIHNVLQWVISPSLLDI